MRTITKQINLFLFSELSPKAKERAIQDYFDDTGYSWSHEAIASLEKLAEHFGGKLANWSIDFSGDSRSFAKFSMPDEMPVEEIRDRFAALGTFDEKTLKGNGDCVLTGYCHDESAIDGFRIAYHAGETDLTKLMEAAFRSWLAACQSDYADQQSEEQFSETCEANKYEFTEAGKLY